MKKPKLKIRAWASLVRVCLIRVSLTGVHFTGYLTGYATQGRVYTIDVPLSRASLAGMYPTGMHLISVHLIYVHFIGVHLLGAHLIDVHSTLRYRHLVPFSGSGGLMA